MVSAILRLWNISSGDPIGDEVLYAFRAVGILDFDEAEFQTTPLQWFDPQIPFWTKLSFHDHPPLVFLIQHLFIKIFGENNFAFRFPSALLGIASVYLVYLLSTAIFSKNTGLIAAAILSVTVNHVFISRIGLQEAYVIFFLLLTSYFFVRSLKNDHYFLWTGLSLGLSFLTKYTSFVLVPIFLTFLLIFRRDCFKKKNFWLGIILSLLIFSPVIFYNLKLYQTAGHFDFQLSYIFGQHPEVWKVTPGKEEIGDFKNRLNNFLSNLFATHSWIFLSLFLLTVPFYAFFLFRNPKNFFKQGGFLIITFIYLILSLFLTGPTFRFLTVLTPFFAIGLAFAFEFIYRLLKKRPVFIYGLLVIFLAFEIFYSFNSQIRNYPLGKEGWLFSRLRYENYNWGYNKLGEFLNQELKNKRPAFAFNLQYRFLEDIQNQALEKAEKQKLEPYSALIIYDGNIYNIPQAWFLDRLQIYHGWPVLDAETYLKFLNEQGKNYFKNSGFKINYFIKPTPNVVLRKLEKLTLFGETLEQELRYVAGINPSIIYNDKGQEIFRIYKF